MKKRILAMFLSAVLLLGVIPGLAMAEEKTTYAALKVLPEYIASGDPIDKVALRVIGIDEKGVVTDVTNKVDMTYDVYAGDAYQVGSIAQDALTFGNTRTPDFTKTADFGYMGQIEVKFYKILDEDYTDPSGHVLCMKEFVVADNAIVRFSFSSDEIDLNVPVGGADTADYVKGHILGETTIKAGQALNNFIWSPADLLTESCAVKDPTAVVLTGIDGIAGVLTETNSPAKVTIGGWTNREEFGDPADENYYLEDEDAAITRALASLEHANPDVPEIYRDANAKYKFVAVSIEAKSLGGFSGITDEWTPDNLTIVGSRAYAYSVADYTVESGKLTMVICAEACAHENKTLHEAVTPTCLEGGNTAYYVCDDCGALVSKRGNILDPETVFSGPLGHSWDNGVVTAEPTETEKGVRTYTCKRCHETKTEDISPLGVHDHVYTDTIVEPTCTEDGYTVHTCTCGDEYIDTYVEALGHDFVLVDHKDPTCEEDGYNEYKCRCGDTLPREVIPANGHVYVDVVTEPTCTEEGYTVHTCSCGDEYIDAYVDPLGHTGGKATCSEHAICDRCEDPYGDFDPAYHGDYETELVGKVDATCENAGYTGDLYCTVCGQMIEEGSVIDPFAHKDAYLINVVDATCEEDGYSGDLYCPDCDKIITEGHKVDKLGHTLIDVPEVKPTCEGVGYTAGVKCSECGKFTVEPTEIPALGHAWDNGHVTTEADCIHEGVVLYTCERCKETKNELLGVDLTNHCGHITTMDYVAATCTEDGYTGDDYCEACGIIAKYGEVIPALGHSMIKVDEVAAKCNEQGSIEYYACETCGKWYADKDGAYEIINHNTVITPELGHDWDDGVVTTEPTETEDGVRTYTCKRCKETRTEVIPALGHTHVYTETVVEPTCMNDGYTIYTCKCGDEYTDNIVKALGHLPGEEATCTEDQICERCKEVLQEKLGHNYSEVVTDPTCTEKGYTTHTCERCHDTYNDEYVDELGHDWDDGVITVEATEEEPGVRTYTCKRCHETKTEEIPALDHVHVYSDTVVEPTCTEDGYTVHTCKCGDEYTDTPIDALGHDWGEGVVTTEPTETSKGVRTYTCSRCKETKTEEIPELAHQHKLTKVPAKAATCDTAGNTEYYVCECGQWFADTEGLNEIKDHNSVVTAKIGHADLDKDGKCDHCGTDMADEPAPQTGDNTIVFVIIAAAALFVVGFTFTSKRHAVR